jgi:hypothetical protein
MTPSREAPCIEPIPDGARWCVAAATWRWSLRARPSGDAATAINPWGASQLAALLAALTPLARVRELRFATPAKLDLLAAASYLWTPGEPHAAFERSAIELVRTAVLPIAAIHVVLDVCVWLRTPPGADAPVRGWIGAALRGALRPEADAADAELHLDHTLFFDPAPHGVTDAELARLNQPLLRDALAALDAGPGPIDAASGSFGVLRAGIATPPT